MIAELAIGAAIVASVSFAYRTLKGGTAAQVEKQKAGASPNKQATGPRGLRVGDVLLYAGTELWLAGAIHLDEEGFAARVFKAPGNVAGDWVVQLDEEAKDLAVGRETAEVPDGKVPTSLPIRGMRLDLRRRGSVMVRVEGDSLPPVSEKGDLVILGGAGGRTLVVIDFEGAGRLALDVERTGHEMFELLPGGDDDQDV